MRIRRLLITKFGVEVSVGALLLICPSPVVSLLLGVTLDGPAAVAVGRVAGAALLAMGAACGLARNDGESRPARGLIAALLIYDLAMIAILLTARFALGMTGLGLWPAVILHTGLGISSLYCLI